VMRLHHDLVSVPQRVRTQPGPPEDELDAGLRELRRDVRGLSQGQALDPGVHGGSVKRRARRRVHPYAKAGAVAEFGHHPGRGDERLRRHTVGEHARSAGTLGLDDRDLRPQLGGHEGRLIPGRSTADDHHTRHGTPAEPSRRLPSVAFSLTPIRTIVIAVRLYAAYGSSLDPGRM